MYPQMKTRRRSTTISAIGLFERQRAIVLPEDYKRFLIETNGGIPVVSLFPVKGREYSPFDNVQAFLGIGVPIPTSELAYAYDLYAGGLPFGIVPIANQDEGNYVCLDLRGGKEKIVFWDKRHFWSTGEWREQDLYAVADSFDQFLTLLRPNPY